MKSPVFDPARSILAMAVCLLSSALQAQTEAAASAPAAAASESAADDGSVSALSRVVVTAQKRPQFAEKVPMSLSALGQEQLEKQGAADIQDLSRLSPGLSAASASTLFGTPNIAIRGISSTAGAATTAIYIDDAPVQTRGLSVVAGGTAYPQLFDLDRVEVLRGPQGTLFGSSAEGGAIRFITPTPRSDRIGGEMKLGIAATEGGDLSYQAGVAVGGPIKDDTLAFRASIWRKQDGGYIDHVDRSSGALIDRNTNGSNATVGRVALLIRPTSALTISPSVFLQATHDQDRNTFYEDAGTFKTYNHVSQPTKDRFSLSALSVSYELDDVTLKSVTSYLDRKQRRTDDFSYVMSANVTGLEVLPDYPDYLALNYQRTSQNNLTQEFRLASNENPGSRLNWVAGVYLSRARQSQAQRMVADLDPLTLTAYGVPSLYIFGSTGVGPDGSYAYTEDDVLKDRSEAVFGEANIKLRPDTTLSLGLRAGRNEFNFSTVEDGPLAGGAMSFSGRQRGHSLLPKVSLSREVTSADLVYASAGKGDRVGGANPSYSNVPLCGTDLANLGISDVPRTYDADSLWSYEVGYKGRMLDQRLELAGSLYYIDWRNIQSNVTLPTCLFGYTANLGKARSVGGDVQLQYRATRQLLLSTTLSYTDAKYTQTTFADGSQTGSGDALAYKGQSLPIPGVNLTLGAEYSWVPGEGMKAYVRGDYQYGSSYKRTGPSGSYNYDEGLYRAPATNYVSLHSGLRVGSLDFSLYVNNLLNSRTELMRTHDTPAYQAATFRPRTLGLSAGYKF